jgi:hypothetical protein
MEKQTKNNQNPNQYQTPKARISDEAQAELEAYLKILVPIVPGEKRVGSTSLNPDSDKDSKLDEILKWLYSQGCINPKAAVNEEKIVVGTGIPPSSVTNYISGKHGLLELGVAKVAKDTRPRTIYITEKGIARLKERDQI